MRNMGRAEERHKIPNLLTKSPSKEVQKPNHFDQKTGHYVINHKYCFLMSVQNHHFQGLFFNFLKPSGNICIVAESSQ